MHCTFSFFSNSLPTRFRPAAEQLYPFQINKLPEIIKNEELLSPRNKHNK